MKKIFTLFVALFSISAAFAQFGHTDGRFQRGYDQSYYQGAPREYGYPRTFDDHGNRMLRRVIDRINWRYDAKMREVQSSPYMRMWEKERVLDNLEHQRREEIRDAYVRFNFHDYDRDDAWRRY